MKRWSLLAIGLGIYALALIATAPATLVDARLQDASHGRLRLAEAQGTLWSGRGQLEIRDERGRTGVAKRMAWRLRLGTSPPVRLAYEVSLEPESQPFPVTIFWSRVELANANINLPPATLGYGAPKLASLGLTGEMNLQVERISLGHGVTWGNATLHWTAAGSALSPVSPLGDYALHFEGTGPTVRITLLTVHGPLQLDGQGSWVSGRKSVFLAIAHMPPQFRQQLAPFLRLIGVEQSDGSFALQLK